MKLSLEQTKKYLLACSYGPDSMALFGLLQSEGYNFEVAHVNYHFRGQESDQETVDLIAYAEKYQRPLHIHHAYYQKEDGNFEAWARNERYLFFAKLLSLDSTITAVVIGHHQDDLLETYLLQKKRKNRPYYFGLSAETEFKNMTVLRPLLDKTSAELREYCKENSIPFSDDSSNQDLGFARNKIRHEYVSKLTKQERNSLLEEINQRNKYLDEIRNKLKKNFDLRKPLLISHLLALSEEEFAYLLFMYLSKRGIYQPLSKGALSEIRKILLSPKPNLERKINAEFKLVKAYDKLYLLSRKRLENYEIILQKPCRFKNDWLEIDLIRGGSKRGISEGDYPITIRSYREDDQYEISGYLTPIRRLYIDWKMPLHLRAVWPVFVNANGRVIYVPRYRDDFEQIEYSDLIIRLPFIC